MRIMRNFFSLAMPVLALTALVLGVAACGGSGGGGGDELPGFVVLSGVRFGSLSNGIENTTPYPTQPLPGGVQVPPALFVPGAPGTQDYIELVFNVPLDATTIFGGLAGQAGIAVFSIAGAQATPVAMSLDDQGLLNPANAFPTPDTAPAVLRIYFDTDNDVTTPEAFPQGDYVLTITENLKSFTGGPFCTAQGSPTCMNDYLPVLSFTIGNEDTTPITMAGNPLPNQPLGLSPTTPLDGEPAAPIDSEIILRFSEAVDFSSLVGAGNLTTNDPFITVPRMFVEPTCNPPMPPAVPPLIPAFSDAGHLLVIYSPPTDPMTMVQETLPLNLSFVVYMPDPVLNPTQVRIRFVEASNLVGTGAGQNYDHVNLPPKQPVPGSLPGVTGPTDIQAAHVTVVVEDPNFAAGNLAPATDPSGNPILPGPPDDACYTATTGVTDRAGNAIPATFQFTFTWAAGPPVASNPMPPDATFVGTKQGNLKGLACIDTARGTTNAGPPNSQTPVTYGSAITGQMDLVPNRLANQSVLGTPLDIEIGAWINTMTPAVNNIANPGRLNTGALPGVPDDPNGTTPDGLLGIIGGCMPPCPPQQPWGNYLYVVDGDAGVVKVFNSYNWQLITTLVGIADPRGLAMSPDLAFLYVTNFGQSTVTRVFANPVAPTFHSVANLIQLDGIGPTAVCVQPQNKDLFVCEFVSNTYARVTVGTQSVRKTVSTGLGPNEVVAGMEMLGQGLTNAYLAYIYNFFDDSVSVFEEDSPVVPENNPDGKEVERQSGFDGPVAGCWNWQSYVTGTFEAGCFVANAQGSTVDELTLFQFGLSPPLGFPGVPGFRRFHILKTYNSTLAVGANAGAQDVSIDAHSGLYNIFAAGVTNNKGIIDPVFNGSGGVPSLVLVSYPSAGVVGIFDYNSPALFGTVSVPGCDLLTGYYDQ